MVFPAKSFASFSMFAPVISSTGTPPKQSTVAATQLRRRLKAQSALSVLLCSLKRRSPRTALTMNAPSVHASASCQPLREVPLFEATCSVDIGNDMLHRQLTVATKRNEQQSRDKGYSESITPSSLLLGARLKTPRREHTPSLRRLQAGRDHGGRALRPLSNSNR